MTKQPETQGPAANDRIRKERNAMELAMYRNMGKRRCYRVYGDEPEADVFRFRDERGMVAVYDFTLAGKEIYGLDEGPAPGRNGRIHCMRWRESSKSPEGTHGTLLRSV